jgi:hypothetical protein
MDYASQFQATPVLGTEEVRWAREARNTQPPGLRFRALLTESGAPTVQLHSD